LPVDQEAKRRDGFVTFAHFTCQPRCALKDRAKENRSFGALDVGAKSTGEAEDARDESDSARKPENSHRWHR
jgi:hypothetical protein